MSSLFYAVSVMYMMNPNMAAVKTILAAEQGGGLIQQSGKDGGQVFWLTVNYPAPLDERCSLWLTSTAVW